MPTSKESIKEAGVLQDTAASAERPLPADAESSVLPGLREHVEVEHRGNRRILHRGVYLLPNLFTSGALFAGFYAMVQGLQGNFAQAGLAVFAAALLDGLDGRIARLINAQSDFGRQYDSLSDVISFGLAPGLLMYIWSLSALGGLGQAAAFVYIACAALRLARFNIQQSVDSPHFSGLASPIAAVLVSSACWTGSGSAFFAEWELLGGWLSALLIVTVGLLMLADIPYRSFKELDFRGRVPFVYIVAIVLIFVVIAIDPPKMLLAISALYACSGPALLLWKRFGDRISTLRMR